MNFGLAREIYGNTVWAVDGPTFFALSKILTEFSSGIDFEGGEHRSNNTFLWSANPDAFGERGMQFESGTRIITNEYQINKQTSDDYIAITLIDGVITKNGGQSTRGMSQLSAQALRMDAQQNVIGHIFLIDSGGGSDTGMNVMTHTMGQLKKPKVTLVQRGSVAASAAFAIFSQGDLRLSESEDNEFGSIGMLSSFAGHANKAIDADGKKHIVVYATASTRKNQAFEEAINNDNFSYTVERIDKKNEKFMQQMRDRWPNIKDSQLDGSTYNAGEVIGSMVDKIGGFDDAVAYIKANQSTSLLSNNKNENKAMTAQQLRTEHPAVYAEVFAAGVEQEADRIGAWMAHSEADLPAVQAGIASGKAITATATQTFMVKAFSAQNLANLKKESPKEVVTPEAAAEEAAKKEPTEVESLYTKVKAAIK